MFFGPNLTAQEQDSLTSQEQTHEERLDELAKKLGLTEEQKARLIELSRVSIIKLNRLLKDESLDEEERKSAKIILYSDTEVLLAEFLTEEQMLLYHENKVIVSKSNNAMMRKPESLIPEPIYDY
jgi:DNA-binding XRE family transcriptional regulator